MSYADWYKIILLASTTPSHTIFSVVTDTLTTKVMQNFSRTSSFQKKKRVPNVSRGEGKVLKVWFNENICGKEGAVNVSLVVI